jgi:hypothetical protein
MMTLLLAMALSLQDDAAANEALANFEANFTKAKDGASRAAVVEKLSIPHEKVVSKLSGLLTNEAKEVRVAASHVLGGFTGAPDEFKKSASHALVSSLTAGVNNRDPEMMGILFAAIGGLQQESSAQAIKSHWEDREIKTACAAVSAAGALKCKSLIEPLIELLRENEKKANPPNNNSGGSSSGKTVKTPKTAKGSSSGGGSNQPDPEQAKRERAGNLLSAAGSALTQLTGQQHPTGDEWEKWWSKNRGTFTVPK